MRAKSSTFNVLIVHLHAQYEPAYTHSRSVKYHSRSRYTSSASSSSLIQANKSSKLWQNQMPSTSLSLLSAHPPPAMLTADQTPCTAKTKVSCILTKSPTYQPTLVLSSIFSTWSLDELSSISLLCTAMAPLSQGLTPCRVMQAPRRVINNDDRASKSCRV